MRHDGQDTIYPIALGPAAGRTTLNVTSLANMSSTLAPNDELLSSFAKKFDHTRIVETIDMPVDTLDALLAREPRVVDAIKVDTQGSELGILEGSKRALAETVLGAEIEVSFFSRYRGQALLGDITAFMAQAGFDLIELQRLKRYRRKNAAGIGNRSLGRGQRAGRLAYGDAIFLLRDDLLDQRIRSAAPLQAEQLVLKIVLFLLVYGKPDMAAHYFDRFAEFVTNERRARIDDWLKRHGKGPLRAGVLHHLADWVARHV